MWRKALGVFLIISLVCSSLFPVQSWAFWDEESFNVRIGVEKIGNYYRLWVPPDILKRESAKSIYSKLEFFLRIPPDLIWVNMAPSYPPSSPELFSTEVQRILLFSDIQFKRDIERVVLREILKWDLPNSFSEFPFFWMEPTGIRMGEEGNKAFLISMRLKVKFKGEREYRDFYYEVANQLEHIVNKSSAYADLRWLLGLYVIASYLKRDFKWKQGRIEEKKKKANKKKKEKEEKKVIEGVEFYSPYLFSPDLYFSPYDVKALYLRRFFSRKYVSVGKKKILLNLGGIKLKWPFIWVLSRKFPTDWVPIGEKFWPIQIADHENLPWIARQMAKEIPEQGLSFSSLQKLERGYVGVFYSFPRFKTWFVLMDETGRSKVWSLVGVPVRDVFSYLASGRDVLNYRELALFVDKIVLLFLHGLERGRVYRLECMVWNGLTLKVGYWEKNAYNWEELQLEIRQFLRSLYNFLHDLEADGLFVNILTRFDRDGWIDLIDEANLIRTFPDLWFWGGRKREKQIVERTLWRRRFLFPFLLYLHGFDLLEGAFPVLTSRFFLSGKKQLQSFSKNRIRTPRYWRLLLKVRDQKTLQDFLDRNISRKKVLIVPRMDWFLLNRKRFEEVERLVESLDSRYQKLWLEGVISPVVRSLNRDPSELNSLPPDKRRCVLDLIWRGIVSVDYSQKLPSEPEDVEVVNCGFHLGELILEWYSRLMGESAIVENRILEFLPVILAKENVVRDFGDKEGQIDLAWTGLLLAYWLKKSHATSATIFQVLTSLGVKVSEEMGEDAISVLAIVQGDCVQGVKKIMSFSSAEKERWIKWITLRIILGENVSDSDLKRLISFLRDEKTYELWKLLFLFLSEANVPTVRRMCAFIPKDYLVRIARNRPDLFAEIFLVGLGKKNVQRVFDQIVQERDGEERLFYAVQSKVKFRQKDTINSYAIGLSLVRPFYLNGDYKSLYLVSQVIDNSVLSYVFSALALERLNSPIALARIKAKGRRIVSELKDMARNGEKIEDRLIGLLGLLLFDKEGDVGSLIQTVSSALSSGIEHSSLAKILFKDVIEELYQRLSSQVVIKRREIEDLIKSLTEVLFSSGNREMDVLEPYLVLAHFCCAIGDKENFLRILNRLNTLFPDSDIWQALRSYGQSRFGDLLEDFSVESTAKNNSKGKSEKRGQWIALLEKIAVLENLFAKVGYDRSFQRKIKRHVGDLVEILSDGDFEGLMVFYPEVFGLLNDILWNKWGKREEIELDSLVSMVLRYVGENGGNVDWRIGRVRLVNWISDKKEGVFLDEGFLSWLLYLLAVRSKKEGDDVWAWELIEWAGKMQRDSPYFQYMLLGEVCKWIEGYTDWMRFSNLFFGRMGWAEMLRSHVERFCKDFRQIKGPVKRREINRKYELLFTALNSLVEVSRQSRRWVLSLLKSCRGSKVKQIDAVLQRARDLDKEDKIAEKRLRPFIVAFQRLERCSVLRRGLSLPEVKRFLNESAVSYSRALSDLPCFSRVWLKVWEDGLSKFDALIILRFFSKKSKSAVLLKEVRIPIGFPLPLLRLRCKGKMKRMKERANEIELICPEGEDYNRDWVREFVSHLPEYLTPWQGIMEQQVNVICPPEVERYVKRIKVKSKTSGGPTIRFSFSYPKFKGNLKILGDLVKAGLFSLNDRGELVIRSEVLKFLNDLWKEEKKYSGLVWMIERVIKGVGVNLESTYGNKKGVHIVLVPVPDIDGTGYQFIVLVFSPHPQKKGIYVPRELLTDREIVRFDSHGRVLKADLLRNRDLAFFLSPVWEEELEEKRRNTIEEIERSSKGLRAGSPKIGLIPLWYDELKKGSFVIGFVPILPVRMRIRLARDNGKLLSSFQNDMLGLEGVKWLPVVVCWRNGAFIIGPSLDKRSVEEILEAKDLVSFISRLISCDSKIYSQHGGDVNWWEKNYIFGYLRRKSKGWVLTLPCRNGRRDLLLPPYFFLPNRDISLLFDRDLLFFLGEMGRDKFVLHLFSAKGQDVSLPFFWRQFCNSGSVKKLVTEREGDFEYLFSIRSDVNGRRLTITSLKQESMEINSEVSFDRVRSLPFARVFPDLVKIPNGFWRRYSRFQEDDAEKIYLSVPLLRQDGNVVGFSGKVLRVILDSEWKVDGYPIKDLVKNKTLTVRWINTSLQEEKLLLQVRNRPLVGIKVVSRGDGCVGVSLFDPADRKFKGIYHPQNLNACLLAGEEKEIFINGLAGEISLQNLSLYQVDRRGNFLNLGLSEQIHPLPNPVGRNGVKSGILSGSKTVLSVPPWLKGRLDTGNVKVYQRVFSPGICDICLVRNGVIFAMFRIEKKGRARALVLIPSWQNKVDGKTERWNHPVYWKDIRREFFVGLDSRFLDGHAMVEVPYEGGLRIVDLEVDDKSFARWLEENGAYLTYDSKANYVFFVLPQGPVSLPLLDLGSRRLREQFDNNTVLTLSLREYLKNCPEEFYLKEGYRDELLRVIEWVFPEGVRVRRKIKFGDHGKVCSGSIDVFIPSALVPLFSSQVLKIEIIQGKKRGKEEQQDDKDKIDLIIRVKTTPDLSGKMANRVILEDRLRVDGDKLKSAVVEFSFGEDLVKRVKQVFLYKRLSPDVDRMELEIPMLSLERDDILRFPIRLEFSQRCKEMLFEPETQMWLGIMGSFKSSPWSEVFFIQRGRKGKWKFVPLFEVVQKKVEDREKGRERVEYYGYYRNAQIKIFQDKITDLNLDFILCKKGEKKKRIGGLIFTKRFFSILSKISTDCRWWTVIRNIPLETVGYIFAVIEEMFYVYSEPSLLGKGPFSGLEFRLRKAGIPVGISRRVAEFLVCLGREDKDLKKELKTILTSSESRRLLEDITVEVLSRVGDRGSIVKRILCSKCKRLSSDLRMRLTGLLSKGHGKFSTWHLFVRLYQYGLLGLCSAFFELDVGDILYYASEDEFDQDKGSELLFYLLTFNPKKWERRYHLFPFVSDYLRKLLKRKGRLITKKAEYGLYYLYELRHLVKDPTYYSALYLWRTKLHPEVNIIEIKLRKQLEVKEGTMIE